MLPVPRRRSRSCCQPGCAARQLTARTLLIGMQLTRAPAPPSTRLITLIRKQTPDRRAQHVIRALHRHHMLNLGPHQILTGVTVYEFRHLTLLRAGLAIYRNRGKAGLILPL